MSMANIVAVAVQAAKKVVSLDPSFGSQLPNVTLFELALFRKGGIMTLLFPRLKPTIP